MLVTKNFTWTDENGEKTDVQFGADGENVNINGKQLTKVIDNISTTITENAKLCSTVVERLDNRITALTNKIDTLVDIAATNHRDSWETISKLVAKGFAPTGFSIGEQLISPWTYNSTTYDAPQNIVHFSDSEEFSDDNGKTVTTGKGMFLQWHYAAPCSMPFDAPEALYTAPEGGLRAGVYYFSTSASNTYMFELTHDLTGGQQLALFETDNTTSWAGKHIRVYDSPYDNVYNTAYGVDGDMELSEWDGESGSPLSGDASQNSTDGKGELNHWTRIVGGHNRWSQSAIRQWLNGAAPARDANDTENYPGWWHPQNKFGRIPAQAFTYPGFLAGYEDDFIAAMKPVKIVTACNTITDKSATDVTYDKVFLPSLTQMNIEAQSAEGYTWDYYKELFAANPVEGRTNWDGSGEYNALKSCKINAKSAPTNVHLRSMNRAYANITFHISSKGKLFNNSANITCYACPACVIG